MLRSHRFGLATILAMVVVLLPHGALAHNAVVDLSPAPGSEVTQSPVSIAIITNDTLLDLGGEGQGFAIAVLDEAGRYYGDGCVSVEGATLSAVVALGDAGIYTIVYRYVSADSHSLSDQYTVTFTPQPGHDPAPGSATMPQCGVPLEEENPPPVDNPDAGIEELTEELPMVIAPAPTEQPANPWLVVAGVGVAILAGYALVQFFRRQARQN